MNTKSGKALFIRILSELLAPHGFVREGNYFRRRMGEAEQALYLEPVRGGGAYKLEMLVTFPGLNANRQNRVPNAHLMVGLGSIFHPQGDPSQHQYWRCTYDGLQPNDALLERELPQAISAFLRLLSEFMTVAETSRKFRDKGFLKCSGLGVVMRYEFFKDLGESVPIPE